MRGCEVPSLNGVPCPGHLSKFDDCLAEGLFDWSLEGGALADAGDCEFEGHVALIAVEEPTPHTLDGGRIISVPAGVYLVWTASNGGVTVTEADNLAGAQKVIEVNATRWALWDAGCDPDDPGGHQDCGDFCINPEWTG
jgi:hypothetical protein